MRIPLFGATLVWFLCLFALQVSGQDSGQLSGLTFPLEVTALKAVRLELKDPLGRLDNWKSNNPCASKWTGVICVMDSADGYNHVQELRLLNMNLSGKLSPQLGQFSKMTILNFMWNNISGSIPKEIGNMSSLNLLLLSGNQLSGPLPDELGNLPNITKFQLDINLLSGPIPKSFGNLSTVQHFHMNNNSFSGQIPVELARLPKLVHFLMDNNKLTGYLPEELALMPNITIFQVNNNNFSGTSIPESYTNMSKLFKLTLRHCNLQGSVPDFSTIPGLRYLDLSSNQLTGTIPTNKLSENITTIDLSKNMLTGPVPSNFTILPLLQRLSLQSNLLNGTIPSTFWQNIVFDSDTMLNLNFRNNKISNISGSLYPPPNVTIELQGNPICEQANELDIVQFCGPEGEDEGEEDSTEYSGRNATTVLQNNCNTLSCPASEYFEYVRGSPESCFCAAPIGVGMRLRSPSFSDFRPFIGMFEKYISSNLGMEPYQVTIDSFTWQEGPRVRLFIKAFPRLDIGSNNTFIFNDTELQRIVKAFARFSFPSNPAFGPYDLLNFTLLGPYENVISGRSGSGASKSLMIGIILGAIACGLMIILAVAFFYTKIKSKREAKIVTRQPRKTLCKIEGVKGFSFSELESATCSFESTAQIGQGGYGKVYKGTLEDGTVVAVKRAQQGSLQGEREFFTEIELLSRVHHRNLVPLIGYCDEEDEQMLVYEFMANGSLHSLLSDRFRRPLGFALRVQIALDAAKGIQYLHRDADPPIIHRDIKANNILLDSKFTAKVSDFGISRLAPVSDDIDVTAHVSTAVKGTPGYVDPEYYLTRKLTEKSDVYSLGIVFLELLTAMPPISHGRNIVREVQSAYESGKMAAMIDRNMGTYDADCTGKLLRLALRCCREETKARPTMPEVVRELEILSSIVSQRPASESPGLYAAYSGGAPSEPSVVYSGGNTYVGSDLVSGVFPDIKPR